MRRIMTPLLFWFWPQSKTGVQFRWGEVDPIFLVSGLFEWGELHIIPRMGWPNRGADIPEWVFGHSDFVGTWAENLAYYLVHRSWWKAWFTHQVKPTRCGVLGRSHDLGERNGDQTPYQGLVPKDARSRRRFFRRLPVLGESVAEERRRQKREVEEKAIRRLAEFLYPKLGNFVFKAWDEYRQQRTLEAIFTHQVHALVDCVRATLYKKAYPREEFSSFFETARQQITDQFLLQLVDLVEERYHLLEGDLNTTQQSI